MTSFDDPVSTSPSQILARSSRSVLTASAIRSPRSAEHPSTSGWTGPPATSSSASAIFSRSLSIVFTLSSLLLSEGRSSPVYSALSSPLSLSESVPSPDSPASLPSVLSSLSSGEGLSFSLSSGDGFPFPESSFSLPLSRPYSLMMSSKIFSAALSADAVESGYGVRTFSTFSSSSPNSTISSSRSRRG